ncbi:hypothetical protein H0H87_001730 [Tephrocybe sp. NHM501043]|nr:hypothetical protein H0H87_001730 [Tephrocybe sp. NHM501043]
MAATSQPNRVASTDSPKGRHSVQQGTQSTFVVPAVPEGEYVPAPPTALHVSDGDAFNVDPRVPYLESGGGTAQTPAAQSTRSGSRRFSRLSSLARAMRKRDVERHVEEGQPFAAARSPSPPVMSPGTSSSNTIHETADEYEGTTAVSHDAFPVAQVMGSPEYVEPQPTMDYAKMESPRASITSFGSYISRVKQFFHDLNELPWVAERVTVDFVPGEKKGRRQVREQRLKSKTWYEDTSHSRVPAQLFSDTTSSSSQTGGPTQFQAQHPTPFPVDRIRSLPPQEDTLLEEPQVPTTSPPVVTFEILDPAHPSDAPFATVVPASWSLHLPEHVPTPPAPPMPAPPPPGPQPPPGPKLGPNPLPNATPATQLSAQPQSAGTMGPVGFSQFYSTGETYPTGFVSHTHVEAATAPYGDRGFHPQAQNPGPAPILPSQHQLAPFRTPQPNTWPELPPEPMNANGTPHSAPFGHQPSDTGYATPLDVPTPRLGPTSNVPTSQMGLPSAESTPRAHQVSFAYPRPPSAAPSRASRTSHVSHAPSQARSVSQARLSSAAPSHANRAPSVAPVMSQTHSRSPSAATTAPRVSPHNRPPSAAPSHASRAPSAVPTQISIGAR